MSVEKISALPQAPIDALQSRAAPPPRVGAAAPPAAQLNEEATSSAVNAFFDSLALPLPEAGPSTTPAQALLGESSYSREALQAHLGELVAGRLSTETIMRETGSLLHRAAAERDLPITRLIDGIAPAPREKLPSTNAPDARFSLQTPLLARDENGEIQSFDLYLTRAGARQWEVAIFHHDDSAGGFPFAASPINIERLVIDPAAGQILACVTMQLAPRAFALNAPTGDLHALRIALTIIAILAATVILAKQLSTLAAALFFLLATGLAIEFPKKERVRPSRRHRP